MYNTDKADAEIRKLISGLVENGRFESFDLEELFEMVTGKRKGNFRIPVAREDCDHFCALIDEYNFLLIDGTPSGEAIDAIFENTSLVERYLYAPAMEGQGVFDFSPIED